MIHRHGAYPYHYARSCTKSNLDRPATIQRTLIIIQQTSRMREMCHQINCYCEFSEWKPRSTTTLSLQPPLPLNPISNTRAQHKRTWHTLTKSPWPKKKMKRKMLMHKTIQPATLGISSIYGLHIRTFEILSPHTLFEVWSRSCDKVAKTRDSNEKLDRRCTAAVWDHGWFSLAVNPSARARVHCHPPTLIYPSCQGEWMAEIVLSSVSHYCCCCGWHFMNGSESALNPAHHQSFVY